MERTYTILNTYTFRFLTTQIRLRRELVKLILSLVLGLLVSYFLFQNWEQLLLDWVGMAWGDIQIIQEQYIFLKSSICTNSGSTKMACSSIGEGLEELFFVLL